MQALVRILNDSFAHGDVMILMRALPRRPRGELLGVVDELSTEDWVPASN